MALGVESRSISMKRIFATLLFCHLFFQYSCSSQNDFAKSKRPEPAPDYANEKFWIALPWQADNGDVIPPGCTIPEDQKNAAADVFYVHPTVYLIGKNWNGDLDDKSLNHKGDECVKFQAAVFNSCAQVYAPRYRQAHIRAFIDTTKGKLALDFAYTDVKLAFEHYLKNWNKGRPIILAGHSQGAHHLIRLLKEYFDGTPLQKQLVAAYTIGMPIRKNEFKNIPVGDSATQVNCFVTWNTALWGSRLDIAHGIYKGKACVNPLTWSTNDWHAPKELNMGGLPFSFNRIDKNVCDAKVNDGLLWVHLPLFLNYYHMANSYHVSDMNLFYMNIRQNAKDRVNAYMKLGK